MELIEKIAVLARRILMVAEDSVINDQKYACCVHMYKISQLIVKINSLINNRLFAETNN